MKLVVESTTKTVEVDGVPARIWEGHTASGIPVHCYITRIGVPSEDRDEFEAELQECRPPSADVGAIPMRLLL